MKIFLMVVSITMPIFLGYFFKFINLFNEDEILTLRKFVIKVTVPFIIFKNLYSIDISTLNQIYPATFALFLLSLIFTISSVFLGKIFVDNLQDRNAYIFSCFSGNYGYLGWGVMAYFFGNEGFVRSVFFTTFFWPALLLSGFGIMYFSNQQDFNKKDLLKLLLKHSSIPLITTFIAIFMNITNIEVPKVLLEFISKFASITIPMILFTIGLNFHFKMNINNFMLVLNASFHRLILGFFFGLITLYITKLFFEVDRISTLVILVEATMPTAVMTSLFSEYVDLNKKLQSKIITFSTLLSLVTIPLWYLVLKYFEI